MKRFQGALLAGFFVFVLVRALTGIEAIGVPLLCFPSAWLAGLFLGTPLGAADGVPVLIHPSLRVAVGASCSGGDFFALLAGAGTALAVHHRAGARSAALLPIFIYALAIAANAFRIVAGAQARLWSEWFPAAVPDETLHSAVGAAVFSTVLITTCRFLPWFYENPRIRAR